MTLKNILVLFLFCTISRTAAAQSIPDSYNKNWKKVDSLISKKALPQSALQEVNTIYNLAKKEKNDPQIIKSLIYRISLQNQLQEEGVQKNIDDLESEMKTAQQPAASILNSILAETYWSYFQQHRYQLYDRTKTADIKKETDIATWSIDDFHKKISALYLSSIKDQQKLQQTSLGSYDAIIIKGNARYLRPTLFDVLTHRALEYFKNDEREISKPVYAFEMDQAAAFADAVGFANTHFITTDSASIQYKALLLFQELIRFHAQDAKPDALIDVDIERIQFVNQHSTLENKEELYTKSLTTLTNKYPEEPSAAQAWYLQALQLTEKTPAYDPLKDTTNRYALVQAKAVCEKVIAEKDSSEGKGNCINLLHHILQKELRLIVEKINVPGQPFRVLVEYANFSQLYFRVILIDKTLKESIGNNQWRKGYWESIVQVPSIKRFTQTLPETNDYRQHAAEIKIDPLPPGEYALLASVSNDFTKDNNPLAIQYFYVSNIAYINNGQDYFVLNRDSGHPLAQATAQVWNQYYDNKTGKYNLLKSESYHADQHGYFLLKEIKDSKRNAQLLEITTPDDHLFLDDQLQHYSTNSDEDDATEKTGYEKNNLKTFLFTDRSVYRPGQPVYFKGIVLTKDFSSKQSKIIADFKTKVILYNANEEKVDSLELTTNAFGSYHGKFTLPENLLNGEFKIEDDSSGNDQSFSVEEYKRPKFYLDYEKLKGTYRINDSIKITGLAKAYAGNNIDGATVKYRVLRQAHFPHPELFARWGVPTNISEQEIAHGEMKTNADGRFTIIFAAVPDKTVSKALDPIFDYKITTDVTDINGETRSGEKKLSVGYKALHLFINTLLGDNLPADSLKMIYITTTNLSDEFEPSKVNITIYLLKSPDRLVRQRFWKQPDQFVMSKEKYLENFPYDEYSDETKKENWEKLGKVFEITDSAKEGSGIQIHGTKFAAGWYLIEAVTKDEYGANVKNIKYIQLYDPKTGSPASPQYNWTFDDSYTIANPGDKATVNVGSSANDLFIIQQAVKKYSSISEYSFTGLTQEKKSLVFPITESDRGGFGVVNAFIRNNRFYYNNHTIAVPWTNKDLDISFETYRDKTLPGSAEKWKVKISGYKKDKVSAEVLAVMYDGSLDQFKKQEWNKPEIYPVYYAPENWNVTNNFSAVTSVEKYLKEDYGFSFFKTYDQLTMPAGNQPLLRMRGAASLPMGAKANSLQAVVSGFGVKREEMADAITLDSTPFNTAHKKNVIVQDVQLEDLKEDNGQPPAEADYAAIQIRKNFNETAFFFPDLKTDSSGNVEFSFTMPEAVTRWKWMTLAHTKDLAFGYAEKNIITQKQLMVQPNAPRFLREGDHLELSTKIVNLTDSEFTGQVELQLLDATTNQPVDGWFQNMQANQYFTVAAKQSEAVSFPLQIPYQFNKPLTYKIIARAPLSSAAKLTGPQVSDGEEATLPVLSNRMLVTETLPLNMHGSGTKNFAFEKLLKSSESETLNHHALTIEFTSNPAWYAVQALPYLMEYPYECAEQTFNRFYANALASKIAGSSPRIQAIFEKWKTADTATLLSSLQKNQELKSVLLEESPWVLQAKTESEQKKNIALLFSMTKMNAALASSIAKLEDMQSTAGGFTWFKGGRDDRYITQYILSSLGHLKKLDALPPATTAKINAIVKLAIPYLDKKIKADYDALLRSNKKTPLQGGLGDMQIQYLYLRSFFSEYALPGEVFSAVNYYRKQAQQNWLQQNKYMQGMIALALYRTGDIQKAKDILASLKQNAIVNEETGMYWKEMTGGYYWYQAPVETQSLLIEAFQEITKDTKTVNDLKTWLLKQKQTQNWKTTKATADACYALLLQGTDWLNATPDVQIKMADKVVVESSASTTEAGTGYLKKIIDAPFVTPAMGNIAVTLTNADQKNGGPAWGSVYWQYFENLDKITAATTPLQLSKKLFKEKNTDRGPVLEPITENGFLKVGDKIKVRIELKVDRDMEYVHLKDMRASCMEPVNVLSGYKWQGGLGYYESTKDASSNFFFSSLPRGTYVFEYALFVTSTGNFSNGVTTIQCMYAPEFMAHSEGVRVNVE